MTRILVRIGVCLAFVFPRSAAANDLASKMLLYQDAIEKRLALDHPTNWLGVVQGEYESVEQRPDGATVGRLQGGFVCWFTVSNTCIEFTVRKGASTIPLRYEVRHDNTVIPCADALIVDDLRALPFDPYELALRPNSADRFSSGWGEWWLSRGSEIAALGDIGKTSNTVWMSCPTSTGKITYRVDLEGRILAIEWRFGREQTGYSEPSTAIRYQYRIGESYPSCIQIEEFAKTFGIGNSDGLRYRRRSTTIRVSSYEKRDDVKGCTCETLLQVPRGATTTSGAANK